MTLAAPRKSKSKKQNKWGEVWHRLKKNRTAMFGLALVIFFVLVAIFADLIVPYELALEQTSNVRQPPSAEHIFGTDTLGRDLFARIVHGVRPSLLIGIIGTLIPALIGLVIGGIAGYYGGKFDEISMRIMDTIMCIPQTLLALTIVATLGFSMTNIIIAMAVSSTPQLAREDRALVMRINGQDYVCLLYTSDVPTYDYDLERAKELMAEAGYADGFDAGTIICSAQNVNNMSAQVVQEQLSQIGITVEIQQLETGTFYEQLFKRDFTLAFISFGIEGAHLADGAGLFVTNGELNLSLIHI